MSDADVASDVPPGTRTSPGRGLVAVPPSVNRTTALDLVVCSLEPWDEVWRRNQYLVDELLSSDDSTRVLFVEPPVDVWRHPGARSSVTKEVAVPGYDRLWRVAPAKQLPRMLGPWADLAVRRAVRGAAARLRFVRPVLWINDVQAVGLVRATGWPSLYDITDDWLVEDSVPERVRARRRRLEDLALRESDEVVVCSPSLQASRGRRREVHLIPNGVDERLMTEPQDRPDDLPTGTVAVYVGTVQADRFDVKLMASTAAANPETCFAVVGPVFLGEDARHELVRAPNIRLLGPRPHRSVPAYLQHADVIVVPHLVNEFTESLDPIKAYECLALSTPTVATPVAGFRDRGGPITTVEAHAFPRAVGDTVGGVREPALPREATWRGRASRFRTVLESVAGRRTPSATERRPHLVVLDHVAQLSGGEIALARLVAALTPQNDVTVVLGEDGPLRSRLEDAGAVVDVLPLDPRVGAARRDEVSRRARDPRLLLVLVIHVLRLRGRIRGLRPDLVQTNSLKSAVYGGVAARLAGRPVVWHLRDRLSDDYLSPWAARSLRALARVLPRAVVANSRATLDTLSPGPVPWRQVREVVHDPLPAQDPLPPDRTAYRVGVVGRLAPWKGQDVFLRAFARAFPDGDEVAVVVGSAMFGEDAWSDRLVDLMAELGLSDRVEFRGFRDDVPAELARLSVLVHCSVLPEPFGQVIVEGMAAGLPVVAAAAGGPLEIVEEGRTGLLTPPGDVEALAFAMRRLRGDPELANRLATAGRESTVRFSPEKIAAQMVEVYRSVLG